MIGKILAAHSNLAGALDYVMGKADAKAIGGSVAVGTPKKTAERMVGAVPALTKVDGAVFHGVLALSPEESGVAVGDHEWNAIGHQWMKDLGYANTPYLMVRHSDTDHDHIHIVGLGADKLTGKKVKRWQDRVRSQKSLAKIEKEYGLRLVNSNPNKVSERRSPTIGERKAQGHGQQRAELPREQVWSALDQVDTKTTMAVWMKKLEQQGVRALPNVSVTSNKVSGLRYVHLESGATWTGGELGKHAQLQHLRAGGLKNGDLRLVCGGVAQNAFENGKESRYSEADRKAWNDASAVPKLVAKEVRDEVKKTLRQTIGKHLSEPQAVSDWVDALKRDGVGVQVAFNKKQALVGMRFHLEDQPEVTWKGSGLGKSFTWKGLQNQGISYDQKRDYPRLMASKVPKTSTREAKKKAATPQRQSHAAAGVLQATRQMDNERKADDDLVRISDNLARLVEEAAAPQGGAQRKPEADKRVKRRAAWSPINPTEADTPAGKIKALIQQSLAEPTAAPDFVMKLKEGGVVATPLVMKESKRLYGFRYALADTPKARVSSSSLRREYNIIRLFAHGLSYDRERDFGRMSVETRGQTRSKGATSDESIRSQVKATVVASARSQVKAAVEPVRSSEGQVRVSELKARIAETRKRLAGLSQSFEQHSKPKPKPALKPEPKPKSKEQLVREERQKLLARYGAAESSNSTAKKPYFRPRRPLGSPVSRVGQQRIIKRSLGAMDAPKYRVMLTRGTLHRNLCRSQPTADEVHWTPQEVLARQPFLEQENKKGWSITITPISDSEHHLVLSLPEANIETLIGDGHHPALLQRTRAGIAQVVLKVPMKDLAERRALGGVSLKLNQMYGDSASDADAYAVRLAGFINHEDRDGHPYVGLLEASGQFSPSIQRLVQVESNVQKRSKELNIPPRNRLEIDHDAARNRIATAWKLKGLEEDQDRFDVAVAAELNKKGYSNIDIADVMVARSPNIDERYNEPDAYADDLAAKAQQRRSQAPRRPGGRKDFEIDRG